MASMVFGLAVVCTTSDRTGRHGGQQCAVEADLPHLFIVEHADHHDVGLRTGVGHIGDRSRAELLEFAPLLGRSAQDLNVVPGCD